MKISRVLPREGEGVEVAAFSVHHKTRCLSVFSRCGETVVMTMPRCYERGCQLPPPPLCLFGTITPACQSCWFLTHTQHRHRAASCSIVTCGLVSTVSSPNVIHAQQAAALNRHLLCVTLSARDLVISDLVRRLIRISGLAGKENYEIICEAAEKTHTNFLLGGRRRRGW